MAPDINEAQDTNVNYNCSAIGFDNMKKGFFLSSAGTSLIELSIAVFIGSIIITSAYRSHEYLSRSAERENQKAMIQRDLITATEKMSREIRMAGLDLPGNGIQATLSDTSSDELQVFSNESQSKTELTSNLAYSDIKMYVQNVTGAVADGWVCIAGNGLDTVYRKIANVVEPNTVYLSGPVGAGTFATMSTEIYFCKRFVFKISKTGESSAFTIRRNALSIDIGGKIDTFNIILKNSAGTVITSNFESTKTVSLFVGGYVGNGSNRSLISESIDINVRNSD